MSQNISGRTIYNIVNNIHIGQINTNIDATDVHMTSSTLENLLRAGYPRETSSSTSSTVALSVRSFSRLVTH